MTVRNFFSHRYFKAFILGSFATTALPPFFVLPLLIISFSGLYLLVVKSQNKKQAFFTGWFFGFGHFTTGIYWICYALLTDPEKFAWMIPFAISGLPAVLAIYIGLVSLIVFVIPANGIRRIFVFTSVWVITEILRGILFSGFPWNLIGYSLNFSNYLIQINSVTGIFGASLLVTIFATMPALLIEKNGVNKKNIIAVVISLLIIPALFVFGYLRTSNETNEAGKKITIAVVQANISQNLKWEPTLRIKNFMEHVLHTEEIQKKYGAAPKLIVWPESGVSYFLDQERNLQNMIRNAINYNDILITGSIREEENETHYDIWNSIFVMNKARGVIDYYDKFKLVPFGEFVPLRNVLWFVDKITHGAVDFSKGPGPKTISLENGIKISPSVCYEAIFSGKIIDEKNRPDLMVNVTNDAWFGISSGPHQHFEMARIRAVEEGIPLVRSANTGVSGVIDEYGRVLASTELGTKANLVFDLNLKTTNTVFSVYGILPVIITALIILFISIDWVGLKNRL